MARYVGMAMVVQMGLAAGGALAQDLVPADTAVPVMSVSGQAIVMNIAPDRARRDISVVLNEGLRSMRTLTPEQRAARKAMQDGQEISEAELRTLADLWDGVAALRLVRLLEEKGDAALAADIAWYGAIAVSTGRVWPLETTIAALHKLNPAAVPEERMTVYRDMLYAHAWAGNSLALDAVIDLNGEGRLFGPMSEETKAKVLEMGDAIGDGRIALRMALALWQNADSLAADDTLLQDYLDRAIAGNNLVVRTTALNLQAQYKEKKLEQAPTQ